MSTIVIGVTNHTTALAACSRAFELARPGDQLHLVYAIGDRRGADVDTARRHADGLLESLSAGRSVTVHTIQDDPAKAILDVAKHKQADLIVIGNAGLVRHGRFTRAVPAQVLRAAECSVFVVGTTGAAN